MSDFEETKISTDKMSCTENVAADTLSRRRKIMKKKGFFPLGKSNTIALIAFIIISIVAFFPFVRNNYIAGLSWNCWILAGVALMIPIYCIIADAVKEHKK